MAEQTDNQQRIEELKLQGNEMFKCKLQLVANYTEAINYYTQALDLNPNSPIILSNRSFCHLKLENYGLAEADASQAIQLDPNYTKAYYRRGSAYYSIGKIREAIKDLQAVCKIVPNDKDARLKLKTAMQQYKAMRFAQCIQTDAASNSIDLGQIEVPDSYTGLHMPESLSQEWIIELMDQFKNQKSLHKKYAIQLILRAKEILQGLETLVDITIPDQNIFNVCGDVHGQYYDLINIFRINGYPSQENPYLFNGDFVDRGSWSVEVILSLFAWKILYPNHFHLLRGNHESVNMNKLYGFEGEVKHKYDLNTMSLFSETFQHLPLVAILNQKVMVCHGGLFSQDNVSLDDLRRIDRVKEPPEAGLMCELLWSDPEKSNGRHPSKRGVGIGFGPDIAHQFLDYNGLDILVRSHEMKPEGYEVEADGRVITIFSAPNYCDQMGNKGALIKFRGGEMRPQFVQFTAVPHPNIPVMAYGRPYMFG